MVKKAVYIKIQEMKIKGYSKKRISRELRIDRNTVRKYFDMNTNEYQQYQKKHRYRPKGFERYEKAILEIYAVNGNRNLNMSAVYDLLTEKYGSLELSEKSLRNYINYLRAADKLNLEKSTREYRQVEELPYGKQMQLDFGVWNTKGFKLYIFAALLSRSRYKYVFFQEKPFTSLDVIRGLLKSFRFFGGLPEELVIDQDRTMVVSENKGDILYTRDFQYFIEEMNLRMFVCRKADPQSKGKIENLVKYVKYNFLNIRKFNSVNDANESVFKWLHRRANGRLSQATARIPLEEIETERQHLRPIRNSIFNKESLYGREERIANDKSYIMVDSNNYQLPSAYRKKTVEIYLTPDTLFVFDKYGKQICEFPVCKLKGQSIQNDRHRRQKSAKIKDLREKIASLYDSPSWSLFLDLNYKRYQRYVRDQVLEGLKHFGDKSKTDMEVLERALKFCIENKTLSFANLKDTYYSFLQDDLNDLPDNFLNRQDKKVIGVKHKTQAVNRRTLKEYIAFIPGGLE